MFREGPIHGVVFRPLQTHQDARGWLVELFRHDELIAGHRPVMGYVSQTLPGAARGPHEHQQQSDYFVFAGPGEFKLYLWDARADSPTHGHRQTATLGQSNRQAVLVPPGVVHAYRNIGTSAGLVFNFPDRLYAGQGRAGPIDEIRHEHRPDSPYVLD